MPDKTDRIIELAKGAFEVVTKTVSDEITGIFGKLAIIAEKGTAVFLLSAGATFISLGIALAWHSESLFDKEFRLLIEYQSNTFKARSYSDDRNFPSVGPSIKRDQQSGAGSGNDSVSATAKVPAQEEIRLPPNAPPTITLILGGLILMLGGSATSLISYKWRLDTYVRDQTKSLEEFRLQVQLRMAGIEAISEANQVIGQQAQGVKTHSNVMPPPPS